MKLAKPKLLRLDLQTFAEPPADPPPTDPTDPVDPPAEPTITMTQAEFDRRIGERLAREKAKADKAIAEAKAEAERKKLEEASEFKALYEAEKLAREQVEEKSRKDALEAKKHALLVGAGYDVEKLPDLIPFITGDDEDAITASVERFKMVAPPTPAYVDPAAAGGSGRQQPKQKDGTELGKAMYERIKHRLR